jgi:hypothetical protein
MGTKLIRRFYSACHIGQLYPIGSSYQRELPGDRSPPPPNKKSRYCNEDPIIG